MSDVKLPGIGNVPKPAVIAVGVASAAIIGYAYWRRSKNSSSAAATTAASTATDTSIDPATGVPYADEYGFNNSAGYSFPGVYDPSTGATIGSGVGQGTIVTVSTNAAWAQASLAYLASVGGYQDSQSIGNALGAGLLGHYMTPDMVSIWNAAVAFEGEPPQGHPPLNITPPIGNPPPPTGKLHGPTGAKVVSTTKNTATVSWNAVPGAKHYRIYRSDVGYNIGDSASTRVTIGGLAANHTYHFYIRALDGNNVIGDKSNTCSGKTKK